MPNLNAIDKPAKEFADARSVLVARVQELNEIIDQAKRRLLPSIKHAVVAARDRQGKLKAAIQEHPDLFVKPRTVILYGIKLGMQKFKDALDWDDDDHVSKLIRKHFPEQAETLIKTTDKPVKTALSNLTLAELKKLGINTIPGGDEVVIKPADSDIDKLVDKMLEEEKEGD